MNTSIKSTELFNYISVYEVTEYKDNAILKTKLKGYAHKDRKKLDSEIYSSVPFGLIQESFQKNEIVLDVIQ